MKQGSAFRDPVLSASGSLRGANPAGEASSEPSGATASGVPGLHRWKGRGRLTQQSKSSLHCGFLWGIQALAMGFSYRKSVKVGPFRINLSNRGVGYSVGVRGFRTGVSASGRRYTTVSLPGTGLSYRENGGKGCLLIILSAGGVGFGAAAWWICRFVI